MAWFVLGIGRRLVLISDAGSAEMNRLAVANLTAEEFAPFRMVGVPEADGAPVAGDVPLDLSEGRLRFYAVVRLAVPVGFAL